MAIPAIMQEAELRACFNVRDAMKQHALHLDSQAAQTYGWLRGQFGG